MGLLPFIQFNLSVPLISKTYQISIKTNNSKKYFSLQDPSKFAAVAVASAPAAAESKKEEKKKEESEEEEEDDDMGFGLFD